MIKNNAKTTFLLTSILATTLLLSLSTEQASAVLQPPMCGGGNSVDHEIVLFRANGITEVNLSMSPNGGDFGSLDINENVVVSSLLHQDTGNCDYEDGTFAHLLPNGNLGPNHIDDPPGVPLISHLGVAFIMTDNYQVTLTDDDNTCAGAGAADDASLTFCSFYGNFPGDLTGVGLLPDGGQDGVSYSNPAQGKTNLAFSGLTLDFLVNGEFMVSTLADPRDTTDTTDGSGPSVVDPSDQVTITGVNGIEGVFTTSAVLHTPDGDVNANCIPSPTASVDTFPIFIDCTINQTFTTPGDYCWDVDVDEIGVNPFASRYTNGPVDHDGTFANNECFRILPPYTIETDSMPVDVVPFEDLPVKWASDTITITGDGTTEGNWQVTKANLVNEDGNVVIGSLADDVDCDPDSPTGLVTPNLTTLIQCDWHGDELPPGDYCWDVTVLETTGNFDPSEVPHNGCADGEDDDREQFSVSPPYTVTTLANPYGTVMDPRNNPVQNPSDVVSIHGTDGEAGEFTVTAVLTGPNGAVDAPSCPNAVSSADDHLYPITSTCTTTTGVLPPGNYNWVVTVTAISGNYDTDPVVHPTMESTEEEYYNEHFFIPPTFTVDTDSTPNGPYDGEFPITVITDTVNIYGVNGFPGTFDVTGNFYGPDGIGGFEVKGVTTCDSVSSVAVAHTYPITSTCTVAGVSIEETDVGLYYFADIQVTAVAGAYDPAFEVPAIPGSQDPREQFMVAGFEGCTPGYWKQPQHFGNYPNPFYPGSTIGSEGFVPLHGHDANDSFVQALKYKGGKGLEGAEGILLRAAAAGWINTQVLTYGYVPVGADLVADVNAAIASNDRQTMINLAGTIDGHNNPPDDWDEEEDGDWCPLGRAPGPLLPNPE